MTESVYGINVPENPTYRISFQEWVTRWNAAADVPTLTGLLHTIYDSSEGEEHGYRRFDNHRTLFLLKLADGHRGNGRSGLAHAAFRMLAQRIFRASHQNYIHDISSDVREALLAFFLSDENNVRWRDADLPQSEQVTHADKLASAFMRTFCEVIWNSGSEEQRVQLIELLYQQHALQQLVSRSRYLNHWKRFTEAVMQKLNEVGMRTEFTTTHELGTDTPSLEELVACGSPAAQAVLLIRTGKEAADKAARRKELAKEIKDKSTELSQL